MQKSVWGTVMGDEDDDKMDASVYADVEWGLVVGMLDGSAIIVSVWPSQRVKSSRSFRVCVAYQLEKFASCDRAYETPADMDRIGEVFVQASTGQTGRVCMGIIWTVVGSH